MQNPLIVPVKVLKGHKVQGELGMLNIDQTSGQFLCIHYGRWQTLLSNLVLYSYDFQTKQGLLLHIFFFLLRAVLSNMSKCINRIYKHE